MAFTFYVSTSRLLGCLSHTCICVGFSVVISPLLALDVEGCELGEQRYHVAARGSQSGIQHRWDGHLQHWPETTGGRTSHMCTLKRSRDKMTACTFLDWLAFSMWLQWSQLFGFQEAFYFTSKAYYYSKDYVDFSFYVWARSHYMRASSYVTR